MTSSALNFELLCNVILKNLIYYPVMLIIRLFIITLLYLILTPAGWAQTAYNMTHSDLSALSSGDVVTHVWRDKSRPDKALDVFGAVDIMARPETIWTIMTNCARGNEIVKGMLSCEVIEAAEDGTDIRKQVFDMGSFLPNAKTIFQSTYDLNRKIKIKRTGGDLKIQDAIWEINPLANDLTRVTYRATIKLKFPVPRQLIKNATRKDTPQIMRNLRRVAENDEMSAS